LLLVGGSDSIAFEARWPSDIVISYLIGAVWASLPVSLFQVHKAAITVDLTREMAVQSKPAPLPKPR
jgi:hypothetical protein